MDANALGQPPLVGGEADGGEGGNGRDIYDARDRDGSGCKLERTRGGKESDSFFRVELAVEKKVRKEESEKKEKGDAHTSSEKPRGDDGKDIFFLEKLRKAAFGRYTLNSGNNVVSRYYALRNAKSDVGK